MTPRIALALYLPIALFVTVRLSLPLSTTVYPLVLAAALPYIFRATAKSEADRWIGELSYPFYIFHYLAIARGLALAIRRRCRLGCALIHIHSVGCDANARATTN